MINNTDIYTGTDYMQLKMGGAFLFQGESLYVNCSLIEGNNGFMGGAFMVNLNNYQSQTVLIENSVFGLNTAGYGAVFGFIQTIEKVNLILQENYFFQNVANRKFFIILKTKKIIVGGVLYLKSPLFQSNITVLSNYFYKGQAIWGAYFDIELYVSVIFENNAFLEGVAKEFIPADAIGTGSLFILIGVFNSSFAQYVGYNNKHFLGWAENKGFFHIK